MNINYRSITPAVIAAADKKPGYSDKFNWCLQADIETWAPTLSDGTPGATKRITGNHAWPVNKGVHSIQCKAKSIDGTADAQGEAGGQIITYKYKVIIKGESAIINEFVENIINEDIVAWFNDPVCGQTNLVQLGSECTPANISGLAFRSGSKGAGGFKEYEFVIECTDKFFYEGELVDAVEDPQLEAVTGLFASAVATTTLSINWSNTVPSATGYTVQRSTSADFTAPTATDVLSVATLAVTGLVANTTYFFRIRATATGYLPGPWVSMGVKTDV